jgi:hypothetical protein
MFCFPGLYGIIVLSSVFKILPHCLNTFALYLTPFVRIDVFDVDCMLMVTDMQRIRFCTTRVIIIIRGHHFAGFRNFNVMGISSYIIIPETGKLYYYLSVEEVTGVGNDACLLFYNNMDDG